jgi:peptidyl-prolyl cis-trans isomerase B (cyclophilin B)
MNKNSKFIKTSTLIKNLFLGVLAASLFSACTSGGRGTSADNTPHKPASSIDSPKAVKPSSNQVASVTLNDSSVVSFYQNFLEKQNANRLKIITDFGTIVIELCSNTPLHKANMLYLSQQEYFNGTWFHRVSEGHVIQAGNNDELATVKKRTAIGQFTLPAEQLNTNLHKRGAVAAARSYSNNPTKQSDPFEFYIVLGKTYSSAQLGAMAQEYGFSLSNKQIETYTQIGGAPHLDGQHTVFGQVVEGMGVVKQISQVQVDSGEWPLKNIPISVSTF